MFVKVSLRINLFDCGIAGQLSQSGANGSHQLSGRSDEVSSLTVVHVCLSILDDTEPLRSVLRSSIDLPSGMAEALLHSFLVKSVDPITSETTEINEIRMMYVR